MAATAAQPAGVSKGADDTSGTAQRQWRSAPHEGRPAALHRHACGRRSGRPGRTLCVLERREASVVHIFLVGAQGGCTAKGRRERALMGRCAVGWLWRSCMQQAQAQAEPHPQPPAAVCGAAAPVWDPRRQWWAQHPPWWQWWAQHPPRRSWSRRHPQRCCCCCCSSCCWRLRPQRCQTAAQRGGSGVVVSRGSRWQCGLGSSRPHEHEPLRQRNCMQDDQAASSAPRRPTGTAHSPAQTCTTGRGRAAGGERGGG